MFKGFCILIYTNVFLFVTPCHHYHQNSSKWRKLQLIWLLTGNLTEYWQWLWLQWRWIFWRRSIKTHVSLFVFDERNQRGHKVSFFFVLRTKVNSKIFKYLQQFFKILKNTYSMVTLITKTKSGISKAYTLIPMLLN